MKILICGPRVWVEMAPVREVLSLLPKNSTVIHGGARGLDIIAGYVAKELGLKVRDYPVNTALDGPWPAAGVRRNKRMLQSEHLLEDPVTLGLCFGTSQNLSKGTNNMHDRLISAGISTQKVIWTKSRGFGIDQIEDLRALITLYTLSQESLV